jgi:hypothetical protein
MCTGFWWESQKERDNSEDRGVDGINLDLREIDWGGGLLSEFSRLRIWTCSELL